MIAITVRTKALAFAILVLLAILPSLLLNTGEAVECEPTCDSCHDSHDRVYFAYLDITQFQAPASLDGTEVKTVDVQLRLHGNVGLGYTTIRRGHLTLSANNDRVGIQDPKQSFISMEPGFRSFSWNVSGRLAGTDTMHVEVYALGVHLNVEFFESGDSASVLVTNPVNAPPRVNFVQPDGRNDVANNNFQVELNIEDPNNDPMIADFYYDNDRNRNNGSTLIRMNVPSPEIFTWDTRTVPNGWYYIHVDVDDQRGGTDSSTSFYPVIVSHNNAVPNTELIVPVANGVVYDPVVTLTWRSEDLDGNSLTYEVWVGRDLDHMVLVGTTASKTFDYTPDDNAKLYWNVIPDDGRVRGWCRNGPRSFTTDIAYPVEVDLVLPADRSVVPGPDVKLVWYGRDLDFEQVLYKVFLDHDGDITRLVNDWDDPAGPVLIVPDLVPGETYSWWVEGDNPFSPKGVSQTWTFTIAPAGVAVVDLIYETVEEEGVTLSWAASFAGRAPAWYDVHLVDHLGGDTLLIAGTRDTTYSLTDLVEDAQYHWYVIPYDDEGNQGHSVPSFRTFIYDVNSPPTVTIADDNVTVAPGRYVLEWSGHDPDGDPITYDVYMDPVNGTDLLLGNTSAVITEVTLDPDRMYFWRVLARDARSIGGEAMGVIVTGPEGIDVGASGRLLAPEDGATVPSPVVNLTWQAVDPLARTLLYHIYLDTEGGDPLSSPPQVVNATMDWFILEVEEGMVVSWAVEVQPLRGPVSMLGSATFTVLTQSIEAPTGVLAVAGQPAGRAAEVDAYKVVAFDANGSSAALAGPIQFHFDFGDGAASGWVDRPSVEHTYLTEGVFNATLIVRDTDNRTSIPVTVVVMVGPGDKGSDDPVPGPTGSMGAAAILVTALLLATHSRRRSRGGGA
jgi:hypothetical protein